MTKKILNVVECAYRATLEEQDDTALWFLHMGAAQAGVDTTVLLRANAVNYLNRRQRVDALSIGGVVLGQPPRIADDVAAMQKSGVQVFYVEEDAGERGLERADLIPGVRAIARNALARFVSSYDLVFHW